MTGAPRKFDLKTLVAVVIAVVTTAAGYEVWQRSTAHRTVSVPPVVQDFGHQKVIYHLTESGGYLGGKHRNWLTNMENHFAALAPGGLDLVVVMNGDGVDLLSHAKSDTALASRIDALKARGARFLVCRNTLVSRGIDPSQDLYGVARTDLIGAGVAEIALLEGQGYGYLKP